MKNFGIIALLSYDLQKWFVSFSKEVSLTYLVIPWLQKFAWLSSFTLKSISYLVSGHAQCPVPSRSLSHCFLTICWVSPKTARKGWKLPNYLCLWGTQRLGSSHLTFSDLWGIWSDFLHLQWFLPSSTLSEKKSAYLHHSCEENYLLGFNLLGYVVTLALWT